MNNSMFLPTFLEGLFGISDGAQVLHDISSHNQIKLVVLAQRKSFYFSVRRCDTSVILRSTSFELGRIHLRPRENNYILLSQQGPGVFARSPQNQGHTIPNRSAAQQKYSLIKINMASIPTGTVTVTPGSGPIGNFSPTSALLSLLSLAPTCFSQCLQTSNTNIPGMGGSSMEQSLCNTVTSASSVSSLEACIAGACGKQDLASAGNFLVQNAASVGAACAGLQAFNAIASATAAAASPVPTTKGLNSEGGRVYVGRRLISLALWVLLA
ncbi:hypothetical protein BC830DRAFT_1141053 [Chytriomyces sp. MP71]|nr:hypothetical protein BC830DRAFT_1141053 [Chytriomyces sp. MP71]